MPDLLDPAYPPAWTGPLTDGALQLIEPHERWIEHILHECSNPATRQIDERLAKTSRRSLLEFLRSAPRGRVRANPARGIVAAQHLWMRYRDETTGRWRMGGGMGIRFGHSEELRLYAGNIGYHVYPTARGNHFAERACRLAAPLLRAGGVGPAWITCNPDNVASRRTCERLGAVHVDTVVLPANHPFRKMGEQTKCRYRWDIV